ncbi:ELWxxDGT repeat protein [Azospirillum sp.]|uniref:ELWxxDGT repeat protein n=1 Tax=Azospirillum sp. TaxID=34012 RepID=UPI002D630216|nr:ELWxxDGT repeat protein [Azospirillum sp.]HYF89257.1 ELWxxDGT repeat protein [Azospirillum sp.]
MERNHAQDHGASGRTITGGRRRDLLFGGDGNDTIIGNRGNDYMEGGGGSDRFVLKPGDGWDCIGDFQGGAGGDLLDLRSWSGIGSLEDVLSRSHQDSDGLVLNFGPRDGVKLMGLSQADLTADNLRLKSERVKASAVFAATDGTHGNELWGTDGRRAFLLRDLAPGAASSEPGDFVELGGRVLFSADDGIHGRELWSTDGTPAGTRMVTDINPGEVGSSPTSLTEVNGQVFFQANDGQHGAELWVSDGTAAGTHMVKDIGGAMAGVYPYNLTAVEDELFFSASDSEHGRALWRSDGTEAGTMLVKDFYPGPFDPPVPLPIFPAHFTAVDDRLFLTAWDGTGFYSQLWVTDGTEEGTTKLYDGLGDNPRVGRPVVLTAVGDTLFFNRGEDLWKSDGTPEGTVQVKDFPSIGLSLPSRFSAFDDRLAFVAGDAEHGEELWISDGTEQGTRIVKDIAPGSAGSGIGDFAVVDDTLFFTADDGIHGRGLWMSDGTEAGTHMVTDRSHDTTWTQPTTLRAVGDSLYFSATDANQAGALFHLDPDRSEVTQLASTQPISLLYGTLQIAGV